MTGSDGESTTITTRTTGEMVSEVIERHGSRTAFTEVHPTPEILPAGKVSEELTYRQLDQRSNRFARFLRELGVDGGDVVSYQLPNWIEFPVVYLAVNKLGAVNQPILPEHREHEVEHMVELCGSDVLVVPSCFRGHDYVDMVSRLHEAGRLATDRVIVVGGDDSDARRETSSGAVFTPFDAARRYDDAPVADYPDGDDLAQIVFTSGTTGEPKGVRQTEAIGMEQALALESEALQIDPSDVVFAPAPLGHNTGFQYCLRLPMLKGASAVLFDKWEPAAALETLAEERCTIGRGATPFLKDILDLPGIEDVSLPHLRAFIVGGTSLPAVVVREAYEAFENLTVMSAWGQTENGIVTVTRPGDDPEVVAETDGTVLPHCEIAISSGSEGVATNATTGELVMRGTSLFAGYHRRPELTEAAFTDDGWFKTGDIASLRDDGYITIVGRKKDIIIRGGENISAAEVEEALLEHPAITEVAVVAMPDERLQERPCAYITTSDGTTLTVADLSRFLEEQGLKRQKHPERVELVADLPRNPSGKVQKFKLREDVTEKMDEDPAG